MVMMNMMMMMMMMMNNEYEIPVFLCNLHLIFWAISLLLLFLLLLLSLLHILLRTTLLRFLCGPLSTLAPLPPRPPNKIHPTSQINHSKIKHDKCREDPEIPPFVCVVDIEAACELVAVGVLAQLAQARAIGCVAHIAAGLRDKGSGVGVAAGARRRGETGIFFCVTVDGEFVDSDAQEAGEEIVEWREVIHPTLPESRQSGEGDDDAAERDNEEEEDRDEEGCEEVVGRKGCDGLAEADVIEFEEEQKKVGIAGSEGGCAVPHTAKPPAAEVDGASDEGVRDFDKDGGGGKCKPAVDSGGLFTGREDIAECEELRLQLLD